MKQTLNHTEFDEPIRKLSWWRVFIALTILSVVSIGLYFSWHQYQDTQKIATNNAWFASYVDATATPIYPFEQLNSSGTNHVVLSFIVASPNDPCLPTWGGFYTIPEAKAKLDLDRRIARLRQQGGTITISFGGLNNDELGFKCTDINKLIAAYQMVIDQYSLDTIDLDLEGEELNNNFSLEQRAIALSELQKKYRSENKNLAIWLTLPVAPQGLTETGTNAIKIMLAKGVDLAGVNVMTMDYGGSKNQTDSMNISSQKALTQTHRQLGILYKQAGIELNTASLWNKLGATPMIGQNDVVDEIFTIQDAQEFNQFVQTNQLGRLSIWSANRDIQCGENYVDVKKVSDSCSGVKQEKYQYARLLSQGFDGSPHLNAGTITKSDPDAGKEVVDDPAKSPYQIWKEPARYLAGTKVVWHGNVYQAKWWTQGDTPDNPVLQSWETPWQLLGPVLPGETPLPLATLAKGTYPEWNGDTEYSGGQRILFEGIPYQAKWWTKGDSPETASADPDSSPWFSLTQNQINELLKNPPKTASGTALTQ
jgi:chitinase